MEMIITGEALLTADKALRPRIASRVFPSEQLLEEICKIASKSSQTLQWPVSVSIWLLRRIFPVDFCTNVACSRAPSPPTTKKRVWAHSLKSGRQTGAPTDQLDLVAKSNRVFYLFWIMVRIRSISRIVLIIKNAASTRCSLLLVRGTIFPNSAKEQG